MATYTKFLTRGLESALDNTAIENGKLRFTTDTSKCFLDLNDGKTSSRVQITDLITSYTEAQIKAIAAANVVANKLYIASDNGSVYYYKSKWIKIGPLTFTATTRNANYYIWFSGTGDRDPIYATTLYYNPSTKTFTVNGGTVNAANVKGTNGTFTNVNATKITLASKSTITYSTDATTGDEYVDFT